jgi:hypothetical protein
MDRVSEHRRNARVFRPGDARIAPTTDYSVVHSEYATTDGRHQLWCLKSQHKASRQSKHAARRLAA